MKNKKVLQSSILPLQQDETYREDVENFIDDQINHILARECYNKSIDPNLVVKEAFNRAYAEFGDTMPQIDSYPFVVGVNSIIEEKQLFSENQGELIREIFNQAATDFCKDDEEIESIIYKRSKNNH